MSNEYIEKVTWGFNDLIFVLEKYPEVLRANSWLYAHGSVLYSGDHT